MVARFLEFLPIAILASFVPVGYSFAMSQSPAEGSFLFALKSSSNAIACLGHW